jgi:transcriptional regulator with XRE-family HTH domain
MSSVTRDAARVRADAARAALADARRFGDAFHEQRLRLGVTKEAVARTAGVSRPLIWRIEHGDPGVALVARAVCAQAIGGTAKLSFFADATPLIYDAAHARIVERIVGAAGPGWTVRLEMPVPGPGSRSVDVRLDGQDAVVLIEVETHVRRWEEILRELAGKRMAFIEAGESRAVHVVLAVPPTRHHRDLVQAMAASVAASLPVPSRAARQALTNGGKWPGDGLLWIAAGSSSGARQADRLS